MLLNFEPVSMAQFNTQWARVKIQHLWSQYAMLKNDPWANFQPSSKYCYTGCVKPKSLKLVVIAP
jgi:hypothetical protein